MQRRNDCRTRSRMPARRRACSARLGHVPETKSPVSRIARLVLQRLGLGLGTLLVVSIVIFGSVELLPGDAAEEILGQAATPETVAALRVHLGLDQPPITRYFHWLGGMLTGGFGWSIASDLPISQLIGEPLRHTLFLSSLHSATARPLAF